MQHSAARQTVEAHRDFCPIRNDTQDDACGGHAESMSSFDQDSASL